MCGELLFWKGAAPKRCHLEKLGECQNDNFQKLHPLEEKNLHNSAGGARWLRFHMGKFRSGNVFRNGEKKTVNAGFFALHMKRKQLICRLLDGVFITVNLNSDWDDSKGERVTFLI